LVYGRISARQAVGALGLVLALAAAGCSTRASLMYRRAEMFFAQGSYNLAAAEYEQLVKSYPASPLADAALYKLGHLYRVHLGRTQDALAAYRRLAEQYPRSPYAGEALLWCVHLWARALRSPDEAAALCAQLDQCFPGQHQLRARARLEVARAYLESGRLEAARRSLLQVQRDFAAQAEQAATATLLLATLAQREGKQPEQIARLLEGVVQRYPTTLAAAEAQHRLGLMYYVRHKEEDRLRREQMRREAQWLVGVPPLRAWGDGRLRMLAGLSCLLSYAGCQVPFPVLAALSGAALLPVCGLQSESWPVLWEQDPLARVTEACGMAPSVWTTTSKTEAWEAARRVISGGQPVLVAHGGEADWVVLVGWRPQTQEVGLLTPGRARPGAQALQRFLAHWQPAARVAPYVRFPAGAFYVLAVSGRRRALSVEQLRQAALGEMARLLSASSPAGWPSPVEAARQAAQLLSAAAGGEAVPAQLGRWADRCLSLWAESRRVLADFLEPWAGDCARQARHVADTLGALRAALRAALHSTAPQRDFQAAAALASTLAAEEDNLKSALAELAGGGAVSE
jgi:TolA-binding protein